MAVPPFARWVTDGCPLRRQSRFHQWYPQWIAGALAGAGATSLVETQGSAATYVLLGAYALMQPAALIHPLCRFVHARTPPPG